MCDALHFLLDNILIRFGSTYRQIEDIPMGTNYTPLVADLFFFVNIACNNLFNTFYDYSIFIAKYVIDCLFCVVSFSFWRCVLR